MGSLKQHGFRLFFIGGIIMNWAQEDPYEKVFNIKLGEANEVALGIIDLKINGNWQGEELTNNTLTVLQVEDEYLNIYTGTLSEALNEYDNVEKSEYGDYLIFSYDSTKINNLNIGLDSKYLIEKYNDVLEYYFDYNEIIKKDYTRIIYFFPETLTRTEKQKIIDFKYSFEYENIETSRTIKVYMNNAYYLFFYAYCEINYYA